MLSRRSFLAFSITSSLAGILSRAGHAEGLPFSETLELLADSGVLEDAAGQEERRELVLAQILPSIIVRARKSTTEIHADAINLIVACEVTSSTVYNRKYQGAVWPKGKSGVTIGIGYDVGYVKPDELTKDWRSYIAAADIEMLKPACGVKEVAAQKLLPKFATLKIPYDVAYSQFRKEVLPNYVGETEDSLKNTKSLSPLSLGALVSLTYNRGAAYRVPESKDPSGRYAEMRQIRIHMAQQAFAKIPAEIRKMTRLWKDDPNARGVVIRRGLEAELFEAGLG